MQRSAILRDMRSWISIAGVCVGSIVAQTSPVSVSVHDPRLTVHTLVREDIFAGFIINDEARLANGERTLDRLLIERPGAKADIVAWQGWAALTGAVYAHQQKNEFAHYYRKASDLYGEAARLAPNSGSVSVIIGASYAVLGDRLPDQYRPSAWSQAYEMYRKVWKQQSEDLNSFPSHVKGELLAGLAQTAQRTGRNAEMLENLNLMIEKLPNTAYAAAARKWKENP